MKVTNVQIENYKAFRAIEFKPGSLTVVRGRNGEGKSSLLDAIACVMKGGSDPAQIRNGAEEARITIEIDGGFGSGGYTLLKRITPKGYTLNVKGPGGQKVNSPQAFVESLSTGFAFDPLSFLDQKPADQAKYLQQFLKVPVTQTELKEAIGFYKPDKLPLDSMDGVQTIESFFQEIYAERSETNAAHKQLTGYVETLAAQLPSNDVADVGGELERMRAELKDASENELTLIEQLRRGQNEEVQGLREDRQSKLEAVNQRLNEAIEKLREKAAAEIESITAEWMKQTEQASEKWSAKREEEVRPVTETKDGLQRAVSELQRQAEAYAKAAGAREELQKLRTKMQETLKKSERMSLALEGLNLLKKKKLSQLEIPGVQIKNGGIYVDDVPLDEVNTARKYQVALMLGTLTVGDLPLIVVDNAEAMVGETRRQFEQVCRDTGLNLQVIAAFAEDADFEIVTE
jgi:energy-coupling factor transporter ATP-binding protein EcfA2